MLLKNTYSNFKIYNLGEKFGASTKIKIDNFSSQKIGHLES